MAIKLHRRNLWLSPDKEPSLFYDPKLNVVVENIEDKASY
jgi:hypothetical protein